MDRLSQLYHVMIEAGFWLAEGYYKVLLPCETTCTGDGIAHRAWGVNIADI